MERKLIAESEAPLKVIITGEHAVVYNMPAITMALTPRNKVSLFEENGMPCLVLKSDRGMVTLSPTGEILGGPNPQFAPFVEMTRYLMQQGFHPKAKLTAEIKAAGAPKGMGASASISAALASCIYYAMGKKPRKGHEATKNELWLAVQKAEEVAHGGRPSGIDAMTVVSGPTKLTRVLINGRIDWRFEKRPIALPKGTSLIIVDTYDGKNRSTTGEMIKIFAEKYGLLHEGKPKTIDKFTAKDNAKLQAFKRVFERIVVQLHPKGKPVPLGKALEMNQALLRRGGVSSERIEAAIKIGKKHTAFGAKLTGAGGAGGAVIVIADRRKAEQLNKAFAQHGFRIFPAKPTKKGTVLTFRGKLTKIHRR